MENNYYLAESYKNLETVGDIFEKNGKEYITVILKNGREHTARVYRPAKPRAQSKNTTTHVIYDQHDALGFTPKGFIYLVRNNEEEKLQGYCHWHPGFGAYLTCTEDIFDLPFGCVIKKLKWIDICDDTVIRIRPTEEIKEIVKLLFENS